MEMNLVGRLRRHRELEVTTDHDRINALEAYVREHGALVIHLGGADCGPHSSLAFGGPTTGNRSLRKALDHLLVKPEDRKSVV